MKRIGYKLPIPDEKDTMTVKEFRDGGYLQEVNRRFLHPLGLALSVKLNTDEMEFGEIWDYRDDPEGIMFQQSVFEMEQFKTNIIKINTELQSKQAKRKATGECKFGIQTTKYQSENLTEEK